MARSRSQSVIDLAAVPAVSQPMPWHREVWAKLLAQLKNDRLPHALLLVGSRHTGLSELAFAYARLLLCTQLEGAHNCGACHACTLSAAGAHGDFRWIYPDEKSKLIKVEQIRDAVKFSHQTAVFGQRKIIALNPADNMNLNAYNALLKSLEEPAPSPVVVGRSSSASTSSAKSLINEQ